VQSVECLHSAPTPQLSGDFSVGCEAASLIRNGESSQDRREASSIASTLPRIPHRHRSWSAPRLTWLPGGRAGITPLGSRQVRQRARHHLLFWRPTTRCGTELAAPNSGFGMPVDEGGGEKHGEGGGGGGQITVTPRTEAVDHEGEERVVRT